MSRDVRRWHNDCSACLSRKKAMYNIVLLVQFHYIVFEDSSIRSCSIRSISCQLQLQLSCPSWTVCRRPCCIFRRIWSKRYLVGQNLYLLNHGLCLMWYNTVGLTCDVSFGSIVTASFSLIVLWFFLTFIQFKRNGMVFAIINLCHSGSFAIYCGTCMSYKMWYCLPAAGLIWHWMLIDAVYVLRPSEKRQVIFVRHGGEWGGVSRA